MKQKDIALIMVVVFISIVISIFISKALISSPKSRKQKAEVVPAITSDFNAPQSSDQYFNKNSIDPTQLIQIGNSNNTQPFNGSQ